jgi:hypothetical protein
MPEVAGDAAILLQPEDRDGFAEAMVDLKYCTARGPDKQGPEKGCVILMGKNCGGDLRVLQKGIYCPYC